MKDFSNCSMRFGESLNWSRWWVGYIYLWFEKHNDQLCGVKEMRACVSSDSDEESGRFWSQSSPPWKSSSRSLTHIITRPWWNQPIACFIVKLMWLVSFCLLINLNKYTTDEEAFMPVLQHKYLKRYQRDGCRYRLIGLNICSGWMWRGGVKVCGFKGARINMPRRGTCWIMERVGINVSLAQIRLCTTPWAPPTPTPIPHPSLTPALPPPHPIFASSALIPQSPLSIRSSLHFCGCEKNWYRCSISISLHTIILCFHMIFKLCIAIVGLVRKIDIDVLYQRQHGGQDHIKWTRLEHSGQW